ARRRQRPACQHTVALLRVRTDAHALSTTCGSPIWCATSGWPRASQLAAGAHWRTPLAHPTGVAGRRRRYAGACGAPASTPPACRAGGERGQQRLSVGTHVGPFCGLIAGRDHPAALHIVRAGQARRGAAAYVAVLKRASPACIRERVNLILARHESAVRGSDSRGTKTNAAGAVGHLVPLIHMAQSEGEGVKVSPIAPSYVPDAPLRRSVLTQGAIAVERVTGGAEMASCLWRRRSSPGLTLMASRAWSHSTVCRRP